MPQPNQVLLNDEDQNYYCRPCQRSFPSEHSIGQHCRGAAVHAGEWCGRCSWLFVSAAARNAHLRDSSRHWPCYQCRADAFSRDELLEHAKNAHSICPDCQGDFDNWNTHREDFHLRCSECNDEFTTENERTMHEEVHLPRNKECYGCNRLFSRDYAILIHLESGTCVSGVTAKSIRRYASECAQSSSFMDHDEDIFHCPECQVEFQNVSSLFQHVESPRCEATLDRSVSLSNLRSYLIRVIDRDYLEDR